MIYAGLTKGAEFFYCVRTGIKLIARGKLNTAIRRQQRDLRAAVAVVDEPAQSKCADRYRQRDGRYLHIGRAQDLDLVAAQKRNIRAGIAEVAEKNVRRRSVHRVI